MVWEVIAVPEFDEWVVDQTDAVKLATAAAVAILAELGPN
jgi:hypothetical protein